MGKSNLIRKRVSVYDTRAEAPEGCARLAAVVNTFREQNQFQSFPVHIVDNNFWGMVALRTLLASVAVTSVVATLLATVKSSNGNKSMCNTAEKYSRTFCNTTESEQHYTILTKGCSCPTMPNENEDDFVLRSSRLVRAVIGQIAALGHFMPLCRHTSPSFRHDQKSRACHKPRHTSSYSTSCSNRCNTKWRSSHRTPKRSSSTP